jgi:NAD-dependent dihydropyrimidine dehydrogenase PreA subunit
MYEKLMQNLGFPGSNRLRKILEYLMDDEEVLVAENLPGSVTEVSERTRIPEERVKEILERLFRKGVVFPKDFEKRDYYRLARDIIQLHDATLATHEMEDEEYAKLWKEFGDLECHQRVGQILGISGMKVWRVVPAYNAIKNLDVLPYENIREMIRQQEKIAVVPCSCRNVTRMAGEGCKYTDEGKKWHCIQLGRGAEYVIARGSGKEIDVDTALELIDEIERDGLVHTWSNTSKIVDRRVTVNCNCCSDCCEFFLSAKHANIPIESLLEKSRFVAEVDFDECIACGTCVDRCQFSAIELNDHAEIIEEKCFGCGVCVLGCDQEAIKLKIVRPPEHIPM